MDESQDEKVISLFSQREQNTTYSEEHSDTFTMMGALMLNGNYMRDWWELTVSIVLWMALSHAIIYLSAAIVAFFMMRRHPYMVLLLLPMLAMVVIGPATVGLATSMSLAFALSASNKSVSPWHCMVLGVSQTVFMVIVSFSRLLGTL